MESSTMPVLKNIRHERFCQALFRGEPAVRAYETAGYKVHQSSSSRLRWFAMVQERLAELQAEAARSSQVTVESLMNELESARQKATDLNQLSAAVRATGEKIKLSGLSVQRLEISEPSPFTDQMSVSEIIAEVAKEKGALSAWYLGMAYGFDYSQQLGIRAEGIKTITVESGKDRLLAGNNGDKPHRIGGNKGLKEFPGEGQKDPEMRGAPAVPQDFGKPVSQRAIEERKPVVSGRRREIR